MAHEPKCPECAECGMDKLEVSARKVPETEECIIYVVHCGSCGHIHEVKLITTKESMALSRQIE